MPAAEDLCARARKPIRGSDTWRGRHLWLVVERPAKRIRPTGLPVTVTVSPGRTSTAAWSLPALADPDVPKEGLVVRATRLAPARLGPDG